MTKIALDTNILLYTHDTEEEYKRIVSRKLLLAYPVISAQVISEYLNVMKRSFSMPKTDLMDLCEQWMSRCSIHPVELSTIKLAKRLLHRYDFQIFDSIIIASAVMSGCEVLYSEDMHHNMKVEKQLTIINPFL